MSVRILLALAVLTGGLIAAVNAQTTESGSTSEERDSASASDNSSSKNQGGETSKRSEESDEESSTGEKTRSTFTPSTRSERSGRDSNRIYSRARGDRSSDDSRESGDRARWRDRDRSSDSGRSDSRSRRDREDEVSDNDRDDHHSSADSRRRFSADRGDRRESRRSSEEDHGLSLSTSRDGLIVSRIREHGPAALAGLREGDEIISVDGRRIDSAAQFARSFVENMRQRVPIAIRRDGERITLYWANDEQYGRSSGKESRDDDSSYASHDEDENEGGFLGVVFDSRYEDAAVVRQVYPNSPAQRAGVRAGDTILSLNGEKVSSPDEVTEAVSEMQPGARVELQVSHAPPRTLEVRLGARREPGFAAYRGGDAERERDRRSGEADEDGLWDRFRRVIGE